MDITKLTLAEMCEFVERDNKDFLSSLEKYLLNNQSLRSIGEPFVSLLGSKKLAKKFKDNKWVACSRSYLFFPKEVVEEYFETYREFLSGKSSHIHKYYLKNRDYQLFPDEILKANFWDGHASILDENFNTIKVSRSHLAAKMDAGEFVQTRYRRGQSIYTSFRTNFYDHGHGPRNWVAPNGDSIGMENEILFPDMQNKLRFSTWVGKNYPAWICERDGSLEDFGNAGDGGLELVSPPLLLNQLQKEATEISAKAVEFGAKGHGAGTFYGMHITVQLPSKDTVRVGSRLICLINNPKLADFWQICARRKGESFMQYSPFKAVRMEDCFITERGRDGEGANRHRRAIYVRENNRLLEIRIFRANLRGTTVRASLELCSLALEFCKIAKNSESISEFRDYLERNSGEELKSFLYHKKAMRELINAAYEEEGSKMKQYEWAD